MSPFGKGGVWWLHLKRCIIGQAVSPQHILHHIDVGADVEGVAGEQAIELVFKRLDQRIHRQLNTALRLRNVLTFHALVVQLSVGVQQL